MKIFNSSFGSNSPRLSAYTKKEFPSDIRQPSAGRFIAGLVTLFMAAVFVTGVMAAGYYGGTSGGGTLSRQMPRQSIPAQPPSSQLMPGQPAQIEIFKGALTGMDPARREILVRTEVPGLLGPQTRDVPFKIDKDTTMTICFRTLNRCENAATGTEGWATLSSLEKVSAFSSVEKTVTVVGDPETGRIVHVEVEYGV